MAKFTQPFIPDPENPDLFTWVRKDLVFGGFAVNSLEARPILGSQMCVVTSLGFDTGDGLFKTHQPYRLGEAVPLTTALAQSYEQHREQSYEMYNNGKRAGRDEVLEAVKEYGGRRLLSKIEAVLSEGNDDD